MKLFKHYTYTWWQMGVVKASLLLLGVAIGAYWWDFFVDYVAHIATAGVALSFYVIYISLKQ